MQMFQRLEAAAAGTVVDADAALAALPFGQKEMLAWMNLAALEEILACVRACYWSRSRKTLWRNGETSGCVQTVKEVRLDCDGDALLLLVDQRGSACHTGRSSCFYNRIDNEKLIVLSSPPPLHGDTP